VDQASISVRRPRSALVLVAAWCCLAAPSFAAAEPLELKVAYTRAAVPSTVDGRDIEASLAVWRDEVARQVVGRYVPRLTALPAMAPADLVRRLRDGGYHAVGMTTIEYFLARDAIELTPSHVADLSTGKPDVELLLLARRDVADLPDLAGLEVRLPPSGAGAAAMLWLDGLLGRRVSKRAVDFFGRMGSPETADRAILDAFFNERVCCVVRRDVYDLMVEMNPAVARQLRILATSPSVCTGLVCYVGRLDDRVRAMAEDFVGNLSDGMQRQQMALLFKMQRMRRAEPAHIATMQRLFDEAVALWPKTREELYRTPPVLQARKPWG